MNNNKGFTLIELLLIIALLSAFTVAVHSALIPNNPSEYQRGYKDGYENRPSDLQLINKEPVEQESIIIK